MSRQIKTARGRVIDMGALASRNEKVKAVGNVLMNARGDRLNTDGTVRITAEELARIDQDQKQPPIDVAISNPKPIQSETKVVTPDPVQPPEDDWSEPDSTPEVETEPVSKITRTRSDGSKYAEIEYDDGSIETVELDEE